VPVADLACVTVAALLPPDWTIRITDEAVQPVDFGAEVDVVAITGKVTQRSRMYVIAGEFRRRGRTVVIGGPFATLNPEDAEGHADILVTGELEELAPRLFADLASGHWAARYDGSKADLDRSPLPRWDLYPLDRASLGAIQTSRGCPFDCEFCDVIQYLGRKQRFKSTARVLAELDQLHALGVRQIFLVDDNFTVARRRAQALLEAIADWNRAHESDPVRFLTQASIDVARNPELLAASAAAGLTDFYVGIFCLGESMGGFGALRYGLELGAEAVLAMGTYTTLLADVGDPVPEDEKYVNRRLRADAVDLLPLFRGAASIPRITLIHAACRSRPRQRACAALRRTPRRAR
jgi:radical SAM superfamily enzyme YgiQ (UPF0313 family)